MNSYIVNEDAVYRAIGELTIKFQLLENELRETSPKSSEDSVGYNRARDGYFVLTKTEISISREVRKLVAIIVVVGCRFSVVVCGWDSRG